MVQIKEIVKANLCIGCGVCVSESNGSLKMGWDKNGFKVPLQIIDIETDAAKVCPFNPEPDPEVRDEDKLSKLFLHATEKWDAQIGAYNNVYVGFSQRFRETSSSGGIGTYIMEELLKNNIVQHLFVVSEFNGSYEYQWIDDYQQITKASKTRYFPVSMENLFLEIESKKGRVAVSGVPSFIKAIRLKQYYYPKYREKIPFLIGIICGGWKSAYFTDYLAQRSGIEKEYTNQEYRIKDLNAPALDYSFGAYNQERKFHKIKMKKVGDMWGSGLFNANAYDFGDDVTAELADISLGDAWIRPYMLDGRGTSIFVTRSKVAERLIEEGMKREDLKLEAVNVDELKRSQAGGFRHLQSGMEYRLRLQKKKYGLIPYKRKRLFQIVPFEFKRVIKQRMKQRERSLEIWNNTKKSQEFDSLIQKEQEQLKVKTKWYHRIQKVRRILGLKTV